MNVLGYAALDNCQGKKDAERTSSDQSEESMDVLTSLPPLSQK